MISAADKKFLTTMPYDDFILFIRSILIDIGFNLIDSGLTYRGLNSFFSFYKRNNKWDSTPGVTHILSSVPTFGSGNVALQCSISTHPQLNKDERLIVSDFISVNFGSRYIESALRDIKLNKLLT